MFVWIIGLGAIALAYEAWSRRKRPVVDAPPKAPVPAPKGLLGQRDHHAANLKKLRVFHVCATDTRAAFVKRARDNWARYEAVAERVNMPPELIAAIHERESGGLFDRYLHNGDKLGSPTVHVPKGKMFAEWEPAAVDAMSMFAAPAAQLGLTADSDDIASMMALAEVYNGLGYRNRGMLSPYLYSGTDLYAGGKFVADGKFDPNAQDKQLGVAEMVLALKGA